MFDYIKPLAIIGMIPISFIGVFLTFYLFDINFDQGGFASFIMLSGIVVNSGLYILNDFNQLIKESKRVKLQCYMNAFNHKIMPISLTIISTMLGLVPFIWSGQNEVFWYSFASGTIGGLAFSLVALVIYLPLFLRLGNCKILNNSTR
jgi:multidrug efflux pump subunit AcrB